MAWVYMPPATWKEVQLWHGMCVYTIHQQGVNVIDRTKCLYISQIGLMMRTGNAIHVYSKQLHSCTYNNYFFLSKVKRPKIKIQA